MPRGNWRSTYWRKVIEGKTTFLEETLITSFVYLYVLSNQYIVCILKVYDVSKNTRWGNEGRLEKEEVTETADTEKQFCETWLY